jgi:hypothetical protein
MFEISRININSSTSDWLIGYKIDDRVSLLSLIIRLFVRFAQLEAQMNDETAVFSMLATMVNSSVQTVVYGDGRHMIGRLLSILYQKLVLIIYFQVFVRISRQ